MRRKHAARKVVRRDVDSAVKKLLPLFRELAKIRKVAAKLGVFTNERELLTCPKCDLQEDVAITGMLSLQPPPTAIMIPVCALRVSSIALAAGAVRPVVRNLRKFREYLDKRLCAG